MSVDEVADELYGLPPDKFTEARNSRVKELRALGDRPSVEAIRELAKPSVAAWMANLLVRTRRGSIDELLDLGRSLRQAQRSGKGDDIRKLSARRQELVRQLASAAAEEAASAGHTLGAQHQRQLEETLEAAVADESAASSLRAGRLTQAMAHVGFGDVAALERAGRPGRARSQPESKPASQPSSSDGRRSEASRRALARADEVLVRAHATLKMAQSVLDEARERHQAASAARREAAKALQDAEREVKAASVELARSQQRRQRADEAVKKAERERRRRM